MHEPSCRIEIDSTFLTASLRGTRQLQVYPAKVVSKLDDWLVYGEMVPIPEAGMIAWLFQFPDDPGMYYYKLYKDKTPVADPEIVYYAKTERKSYPVTVNGATGVVTTLAKNKKTGQIAASLKDAGGALVIVIITVADDATVIGVADDAIAVAAAAKMFQSGFRAIKLIGAAS